MLPMEPISFRPFVSNQMRDVLLRLAVTVLLLIVVLRIAG